MMRVILHASRRRHDAIADGIAAAGGSGLFALRRFDFIHHFAVNLRPSCSGAAVDMLSSDPQVFGEFR
jgi:hypothetical protein